MLTNSARRSELLIAEESSRVFSRARLTRAGVTQSMLRAQLAAGRWRLHGRAVVAHNGTLSRSEAWDVALISCGPRAVLTSFTAAEQAGLSGWLRDEIHVLVPAGARRPATDLPLKLHRTSRWGPSWITVAGRRRLLPAALVLAASSFPGPRPGAGLLAAAVQQRIARVAALRDAAFDASRTRHRSALLAAIEDIAMGAQALSEIDFVRLCRRHRLPAPRQQSIRMDRSGRRRYLDAEWILADGRRVVAEVDGAVHLAPRRWFDDQHRQNELTLSGSTVLRFPSVVVRHESTLVADQLRRALRL